MGMEKKIELLNTIAEELIADGVITQRDLNKAIAEHRLGTTWVEQLIKNRRMTEETWMTYLEKHGFDIVDPSNTFIDPEMKEIFSEQILRRYRFIPLYEIEGALTIATPDLENVPAIDYLRARFKKNVATLICTQSSLEAAWEKVYSAEQSDVIENINDTLKGLEDEGTIDTILENDEEANENEIQELQNLVSEAPVVRMVNMILTQSIAQGASDIHVCPQENELIVRQRIDGILHHLTTLPKKLERIVVSRLKIMAGMDIAEHRIPQDGRFRVKLKGKYTDVRASLMPTQHGGNMVLRLLHRSSAQIKLDDLGFMKTTLKNWRALLNSSAKIVLVTGPTGSGKTTSLYASINEINDPKVNIMTVEDPIEYSLPHIRQTQINTKIGMTFASGLRAILRQDPDVVMVGEIRDEETARIAVQAALTGHLVFSTLHTNSAIGAISRLIDMGIETYLVTSSLSGVLGQRLVRKICDKCKTKEAITPEVLAKFKEVNIDSIQHYYIGKGCELCHHTGYRGRLSLTELLVVNKQIRELILKGASEDDILKEASVHGMQTLRQDGLAKVMAGLTTIDEVLRVTPEE